MLEQCFSTGVPRHTRVLSDSDRGAAIHHFLLTFRPSLASRGDTKYCVIIDQGCREAKKVDKHCSRKKHQLHMTQQEKKVFSLFFLFFSYKISIPIIFTLWPFKLYVTLCDTLVYVRPSHKVGLKVPSTNCDIVETLLSHTETFVYFWTDTIFQNKAISVKSMLWYTFQVSKKGKKPYQDDCQFLNCRIL